MFQRVLKIQIVVSSPTALNNAVFHVYKLSSPDLAYTVCVGKGEGGIFQLTCDLQVLLSIVWPYFSFYFSVFVVVALLLSTLVRIAFEDDRTHSLRERRFPSTKVRPHPQPTPLFCGLKVTFSFK